MKFSIHTGYKIPIYRPGESRKEGNYSMAINPALYYSQQGDFKQLDAGANLYIDPVIFGALV